MECEITWYKCSPRWRCVVSKTQVHTSKVKVINWGQRSKTNTFCRVRAVTPSCLSGMWNNMVQMFTSLRRCVGTKTQVHTSKVKVINWGQRSKTDTFCRVRAITPSCMDGFKYYLPQMFFLTWQCVAMNYHAHSSKVKVTNLGQR